MSGFFIALKIGAEMLTCFNSFLAKDNLATVRVHKKVMAI